MTPDLNISHGKIPDYSHFHCLGSLYSQNWEIPILKVIEELLVFFYKKKNYFRFEYVMSNSD